MPELPSNAPRRSPIVVVAPIPDDLIARLEKTFEVRRMTARDEPETRAVEGELASAEGLILSESLAVTAELLDRSPSLRVISKVGVGYDRIDVAAATARGVLVCNTPRVLDGAVADTTFMLLLALARRMRENEAHLRSGAWLRGGELLGRDIRGRTLGIVGFGSIGRAVARTARGFDMPVVYYKRSRDEDAEASGLASYRKRDDVFREADVVSIHYPLTADTRRSIGDREFALMKPTSFFINTARGGVVDQPALLRALEGGVIAGAALDVMEPEPLPPTHPLCSLPNVVLTPHIGSATVETRRAMHELAVRNLQQAMAGRLPEAPVNPDVLTRR